MKTETLQIDDKTYEVRELTLEEGMPLLAKTDGTIDIAAMIRLATKIDGSPAQPGQLSMGTAMRLMPVVLRLNNFETGQPGNA